MKYWETPFGRPKPQIVAGEVVILAERCKGCGYCIEFCPRKVLEFSTAFNQKGYHPPVATRSDQCTYCGLCEMICPDFAIFIVQADNEREGARV